MSYEERIALARQEIQQVLNRHRVYLRAEPEHGNCASIWMGSERWEFGEQHLPDIKVVDGEWNPE